MCARMRTFNCEKGVYTFMRDAKIGHNAQTSSPRVKVPPSRSLSFSLFCAHGRSASEKAETRARTRASRAALRLITGAISPRASRLSVYVRVYV